MDTNINISTISALQGEIRSKQKEISKAEEMVRAIPALRADIQALERAIGILDKEGKHLTKVSASVTIPTECAGAAKLNGDSEKTIEAWAVEALRQVNGVLKSDELASRMQILGCASTQHSIMGGVYRALKKPNSPIQLVESGVFGLNANLRSESCDR